LLEVISIDGEEQLVKKTEIIEINNELYFFVNAFICVYFVTQYF
jgi:hypothetical protein